MICNANAMLDYEYVIYVDSDAYLADLDLSLPRLFDRFVGAGNGSGKSLFFSSDRPFSSKPNSGFIVINNTAEAMGFLWRWWNTNLVSSAAPDPCCCKTCWTTSKRHRQSCSNPTSKRRSARALRYDGLSSWRGGRVCRRTTTTAIRSSRRRCTTW